MQYTYEIRTVCFLTKAICYLFVSPYIYHRAKYYLAVSQGLIYCLATGLYANL